MTETEKIVPLQNHIVEADDPKIRPSTDAYKIREYGHFILIVVKGCIQLQLKVF